MKIRIPFDQSSLGSVEIPCHLKMFHVILVVFLGSWGPGWKPTIHVMGASVFQPLLIGSFQDSCIFVQYPRCCKLLLALVAVDFGHAGTQNPNRSEGMGFTSAKHVRVPFSSLRLENAPERWQLAT